jgi:hypothetical protein
MGSARLPWSVFNSVMGGVRRFRASAISLPTTTRTGEQYREFAFCFHGACEQKKGNKTLHFAKDKDSPTNWRTVPKDGNAAATED